MACAPPRPVQKNDDVNVVLTACISACVSLSSQHCLAGLNEASLELLLGAGLRHPNSLRLLFLQSRLMVGEVRTVARAPVAQGHVSVEPGQTLGSHSVGSNGWPVAATPPAPAKFNLL